MPEPNRMFNGTILNFAGNPVGKLTSLTFSDEAGEVDVSGADEAKIVEAGQTAQRVSAEIVGGTALAVKAKGAISITWKDGSTTPALTNAVLLKKSTKGSKNSPITTSLEFAPSTDAT
jgi:hypothetical protein